MTTEEEKLLKLFCTIPGTPPQDFGEIIAPDIAGKAHSHWLKEKYGTIQPDAMDVVAVSFGKNKLEELLKTSGAMGLRFYFVKSTNLIGARKIEHLDLVAIPYDSSLRDIIGDGTNVFEDFRTENTMPIEHKKGKPSRRRLTDGGVLNTSKPCPDYCLTIYKKKKKK